MRVESERGIGSLGVFSLGGYGNAFMFRIAVGGQTSAEDASCIDVGGFVDDARFFHDRVAVNDPCFAAVVLRPVASDEFAGFQRFLVYVAVFAKRFNFGGEPADHVFPDACMRDNQATFIKYDVGVNLSGAMESKDSLPDGCGFVFRQVLELFNRFFETANDLHGIAAQVADELIVVVSFDPNGSFGFDQIECEAKDRRRIGASVDQIADEYECPSVWRRRLHMVWIVAEDLEKFVQFIGAVVDVADDVERAGQRIKGFRRMSLHASSLQRSHIFIQNFAAPTT